MEFAIYSTPWYNEKPQIVVVKSMIIGRCQKPPTISLNGVMSVLDRRYLSAVSIRKLCFV